MSSTFSLLLPPTGIVWQDLVGVLADIPLDNFLTSSPSPFLIELPPKLLEGAGPLESATFLDRLKELKKSPDLDESRVHYLASADTGLINVGSVKGAEVVIAEDDIEERHAQLLQSEEEDWQLHAMDTAGGSYLEGRCLLPGELAAVRSGHVLRFAGYRCLFLLPRDLHYLAKMESKEGIDWIQSLLSPQGLKLSELVVTVSKLDPEDFLTGFPAHFLLQVPLETQLPEEELRAELPEAATLSITRSRILKLQRSKRVRQARVHAVFPKSKGVSVGRSLEHCDLLLDDKTTSKCHAKLKFDEGKWQLKDLGSQNGTFVEGKQIPADVWIPLRAGHKLHFSSYHALFLSPKQVHALSSKISSKKKAK